MDWEQFHPDLHNQVKESILKHGECLNNLYIYLSPLLKIIYDLEETAEEASWSNAVLYSINFFSTKDPSPVHFNISRGVLEKKNVQDNRAVDMLSRALATSCQKFKKYVKENWNYEDSEYNAMDLLLSQFLKTLGSTGKKAADSVLLYSEKTNQIFKELNCKEANKSSRWKLWIDKKEILSQFSPFLFILADVVWEDVCSQLWEREKKNVPALTYGVHPAVTKILSPRTETKSFENQIQMTHEGKIIATLPTIDPRLLHVVTKGVGNLNSIYHHKLIRFECKKGFENWIQEKPDSRVLRFERGCTEIAELIGLSSNRAIEEIKALLTAQAYMQFKFDDGSSGNLIVLRNFRSKGCNRDDGVEIVLGTQLLPHYTFRTTKQQRLLIPVPELPPLVSSSNYHAGQALLQMMVMEEFTEQSIDFAEHGSIVIEKHKFEQFAKETNLPESVFKQTLDRWNQDGNDLPRFLVKLGSDRYALGEACKREAEFLRQQGFLRKQRQTNGERSANLRKKRKKSV